MTDKTYNIVDRLLNAPGQDRVNAAADRINEFVHNNPNYTIEELKAFLNTN